MARRMAMIIVLTWILGLLSVEQVAANVHFVIMHFNDFHARIEPEDEYHGSCQQWMRDAGKCHGGIARMKTAIDWERSKGLPVLLLNAGDDFIGTHWDFAFKGEATASFMNQLGVTAMAVGNHDLDYGPDELVKYAKSLNYSLLSANLNPNGHEIANYVKPYITTFIEGEKIAICGVSTESINTNSNAGPAYAEDHFQKARECVDKVRNEESAKIIILLSHEGYNADRYLARDVYGVDVVVGGHSHAFLASGNLPSLSWDDGYPHTDEPWGEYPTWVWSNVNNRNIPVVQAGWASRYMGRLEVEFNDDGDLISASGWPILLGDWSSSNHVPEDANFRQQIQEWKYW